MNQALAEPYTAICRFRSPGLRLNAAVTESNRFRFAAHEAHVHSLIPTALGIQPVLKFLGVQPVLKFAVSRVEMFAQSGHREI
jgi:hypothetical protein